MTTIKTMKTEKGKQGVDKVDKCLTSIINNYHKQLMQQGVDVTKRVQKVVDVPNDSDYIDFDDLWCIVTCCWYCFYISNITSIAYNNINHFYYNCSKEYYI